jgi:hypothetical protein
MLVPETGSFWEAASAFFSQVPKDPSIEKIRPAVYEQAQRKNTGIFYGDPLHKKISFAL